MQSAKRLSVRNMSKYAIERNIEVIMVDVVAGDGLATQGHRLLSVMVQT